MQRKKTFVVVWVSILAIAKMQAQPPSTLPHSLPLGQAFSTAPLPIANSFSPSLPPATSSFSPATAWFLPQKAVSNFSVYPPGSSPLAIALTGSRAGNAFLSFIPGPASPLPSIGDDYYARHFGFFCQKELQLEKMTHIPFRFRLGSLEQTNFLEGK